MRISGQPANPLATAPIGKMLAKFAVLAIISNLITSVYNIVNQIFIGQNLGILGITGLSGMTVPIQKEYATTSLMNLPPFSSFFKIVESISISSPYLFILCYNVFCDFVSLKNHQNTIDIWRREYNDKAYMYVYIERG